MAILTQNVQRPVRIPAGGLSWISQPVLGYTTFGNIHSIYSGSLLVSRAANGPGYFKAIPLASGTNAAAGDVFGGIAVERVDIASTDTVDGAKQVLAARNGIWAFPVGGVTQANVGSPAYASDDQTITATAGNNYWVGTIVGVDATYVYVDITTAFDRKLSAAA